MVSNVAAALGAYLLLQTVFLHIGYGLHIQVKRNNDISYNLHKFARQKRAWIIPPVFVTEEVDNSAKNPIAIIQSDVQLEPHRQITYKIIGEGATEPPYGLFVIDGKTGKMNITAVVDREKNPIFHMTGLAVDQNGNEVERRIPLRVRVMDINDNSPVFTQKVFFGAVEEMSSQNTLIMRLNATDADEENTLNSKLAFRILSQESELSPPFEINKDAGEIRPRVASIDREQQSSYVFTVEVRDMDGESIGRTGKSIVNIKILDINDNVPKLEKEMYEGSIEENTANVEVLRLKVSDEDEQYTDNWFANFTILSGNENGYFKIETDSATNEGVLVLVKEVDYEELQNLELKVVASNKAAYHSSILSSGGGGSSIGKVVPIKVKVKNVLEGPVFKPKTKQFYVSENKKTTVIKQIIGSYQAHDEDTGKIAQHVKYAKESDPDNWFTINMTTSEMSLLKIPDRESSYVRNGTYIAKILAISEDLPGKTATGTIEIRVEDSNDNCPTIVNSIQSVCHDAKFINITAKDEDAFPNSAPFTFTIVDEPVGAAKDWLIGNKDGKSIQLLPQNLQYNNHEVQILVRDMQGLSCPEKQVLKFTVCTCSPGGGCSERLSGGSASLGAGAIGLMILAFLLLLLVPLLLLLCYCGGGSKGIIAIADGTMETLRSWNNEGAQPEDMTAFTSLVSSENAERVGAEMRNARGFIGNGMEANGRGMYETRGMYSNSYEIERRREEHSRNLLSRAEYGTATAGCATAIGVLAGKTLKTGSAAGGALNEEFLKGYFADKALAYADEDEAQPAKDCLLVYCQEGMESPPGSVGCCSFVDDDLEEDLLDNLGPKFKTLAEICLGKKLITDTEISWQSSHGQHVDLPSTTGKVVSASSVHAGEQQRAVSSENTYSVFESSIHAPELVKVPEMVTQQTMYTEESSRSGIQFARPIPDPHVHGSILVTEKSYTTGPTLNPTPIIPDPLRQQNVVVTERVLGPASGFQGIVDIPDLSKGQNVVVTERLIKTDSGLPGLLAVNERPDSQYVVVTERLLAPTSGLQASLSIPDLTDGQNVIVTERLFTPIDSLPGSMRIPSEVSGTHTVVKERNIISGASVQGLMPNAELLINQPSIVLGEPPASNRNLSQSTNKVTKYSTVQYTRS
uniref:Desmoglein-2 n=1 Tax=Geotrypetes seraphini TaxID=260995 RepID=A0A6P8Q3R8_GEOSA|nr:desmoglein-2 [Geotrypetes seraphini]